MEQKMDTSTPDDILESTIYAPLVQAYLPYLSRITMKGVNTRWRESCKREAREWHKKPLIISKEAWIGNNIKARFTIYTFIQVIQRLSLVNKVIIKDPLIELDDIIFWLHIFCTKIE